MGTRHMPCSGYPIEAKLLRSAFEEESVREEYDKLVAEFAEDSSYWDPLVDFCDEHLPAGLVRPSSFFVLTEEDTVYEPMEEGVPYAYFSQHDLFSMKLRGEALYLLALDDVELEPREWVVFG